MSRSYFAVEVRYRPIVLENSSQIMYQGLIKSGSRC